ncbi:MFS transporter [Streptomyces sp. NPDC002896]|uniref:MFS transporter n=1 Tax=Streptomyces sp. NPDC002896 TaxID=3154438 RepID=UPI00331D435E
MHRSEEVSGDFISEDVDDVLRSARPAPLIIAVLIFAAVVSSLESTMMANALPQMIVIFHTNAADASWMLTAYTLVGAVSAALCGRLGDLYSRRNMIIILLLISAAGSIVSMSTDTLTGVVAGRALQGVAGGLLPLCFGLARENLPKKRVPVATAWIGGATVLSGASGMVISGFLIDHTSWHYIFVTTAVGGLLAAAASSLLPKSTVAAKVQRIDWVGGVLFAPAIALVLFGVTKSRTWTWLDSRTVGTMLAGLVLMAVWAWWELRLDSPMINVRSLANRKLALTTLATMAVAAGPVGVTGYLLNLIKQSPEIAPVGLGLSATTAGLLAFCTGIVGFLLAPLSGRISARTGSRRALIIGTIFGITNAIVLSLFCGNVVGVVVSSVFLSVATTFMLTSLPNLVIESVPAENTSEATGVNAVAQTAFSGVGISVAALILSKSTVSGTPFSTKSAFFEVFGLIGGCSALALVLALFISRTPRTTADARPAVAVQEA